MQPSTGAVEKTTAGTSTNRTFAIKAVLFSSIFMGVHEGRLPCQINIAAAAYTMQAFCVASTLVARRYRSLFQQDESLIAGV
jgi:hypothetical protein